MTVINYQEPLLWCHLSLTSALCNVLYNASRDGSTSPWERWTWETGRKWSHSQNTSICHSLLNDPTTLFSKVLLCSRYECRCTVCLEEVEFGFGIKMFVGEKKNLTKIKNFYTNQSRDLWRWWGWLFTPETTTSWKEACGWSFVSGRFYAATTTTLSTGCLQTCVLFTKVTELCLALRE